MTRQELWSEVELLLGWELRADGYLYLKGVRQWHISHGRDTAPRDVQGIIAAWPAAWGWARVEGTWTGYRKGVTGDEVFVLDTGDEYADRLALLREALAAVPV